MKVTFTVVPWHALDFPCLASGILTAIAKRSASNWDTEQLYANIEWADMLHHLSGGSFGPDEYSLMGNDFVYCLAGEWAFSSALPGGIPELRSGYKQHFTGTDAQFEFVEFAHRAAPKFVADMASRIADSGTDVIAISSTFSQNVAALAFASAVKQVKPGIITMIGGGNCDGTQGEALHRNYGFLDFVVRGEGERAFPQLLNRIERGDRSYSDIPNVCWRDSGASLSNRQENNVDIVDVPAPMYDAYFTQLECSSIQPQIQPLIVVENARGCWWGQKHHCTFCGLNGSSMTFRSKTQNRALEEIEYLVSKHRVLDIVVTDNILDNAYFEDFLPTLAERAWDLRMQYEIKANLKKPQIELMRRAGIAHVQPGIESLSNNILKLMRKGVTGPRNVQSLRDCEEANLTVSWNYLVGFPGESDSDYQTIIEQIPNLFHLQPPRGGVTRISVQRFSPYFNDLSLGFSDKLPHPAYQLIYGLSDKEICDLAFFHVSASKGISDHCRKDLEAAVDAWTSAYESGASLTYTDTETEVRISDDRSPGGKTEYILSTPAELALFSALRTVSGKTGILSSVACETGESEPEVAKVLAMFENLGLIFADGDLVIGLPTEFAEPLPISNLSLFVMDDAVVECV